MAHGTINTCSADGTISVTVESRSSIPQVFQKEHDSQMKYITQLNNKLCGQLGDMQGQLESMKQNSEVLYKTV